MTHDAINKATLLLLVLVISILFLAMVRHFLMALLLAGIFSAMARPLYRRFEKWLGGRRSLASITTLFVIIIILILPLGGLLGVITTEAIKVGQSVTPWVEKLINEPAAFSDLLDSIPFYDRIEPYSETIIRKVGEIVGIVSGFFINSLSSVTMGTVNFFLLTFIFLYAVFFLLMDGDRLLNKILYYLPLEDKDERRMLDKFTSVTRKPRSPPSPAMTGSKNVSRPGIKATSVMAPPPKVVNTKVIGPSKLSRREPTISRCAAGRKRPIQPSPQVSPQSRTCPAPAKLLAPNPAQPFPSPAPSCV